MSSARPVPPFAGTERILIIRLSSLGDVIDVLWSLRALREAFPRAHLAWLVEDRFAPILEGQPDLDEMIVLPRRAWRAAPFGRVAMPARLWRFARPLRRRFDVSFDFQGNFKGGLLAFLVGAPVRVGFSRRRSKEGNAFFNTHRLCGPDAREHRVVKNLNLLRAAGVPVGDPRPALNISPEADADARRFLASLPAAAEPPGPTVVIHPATSAYGSYKRWPNEHFARLIDLLIEAHQARVILSFGPGEDHIRRDILSRCRTAAGSLGGPSVGGLACFLGSLKEEAALIARADVFVVGDTGVGHVASVVGAPTVAIFGPKDPALHGPFGVPHQVVEIEGLGCRPCRTRDCPDTVCVNAITPERVFFAVESLLRETGAVLRARSPLLPAAPASLATPPA
ncbi:MAG: glycosyltransferase family 9 protein [Planctomycetes bacterium]|nr:glycosyltransferase family 9 protein [Planctomycetota bacterium]